MKLKKDDITIIILLCILAITIYIAAKGYKEPFSDIMPLPPMSVSPTISLPAPPILNKILVNSSKFTGDLCTFNKTQLSRMIPPNYDPSKNNLNDILFKNLSNFLTNICPP